MLKFRTEIKIPKYPFQIFPDSKMLFLGSCFADNIGNFFVERDLNACVNPFGSLYNPASVALALNLLINPDDYSDKYIYNFNNHWISFAHSTKFSHNDKSIFLNNIQKQIQHSSSFLLQTDFIFITLGTAFVYNFIPRNLVVTNCHKIPNTQFSKTMLQVNDVVKTLSAILQSLKLMLPNLKIVFTISPIRHLSDGFHQNQLSKSVLHLSVNQLVDNESVFYFPAYEIVMDDLRDYRFYADDLCHIAPNAVSYILQQLLDSMCAHETILFLQQSEKKLKQKNHRPLNL